MDEVRHFLDDPLVVKLLTLAVGLVVIVAAVRLLQRAIGDRVHDSGRRYQVRKAFAFVGYLATVILVITVFSARLSSLTVALGVAGAGIAFALQEVIASVAGWVAVTFSNFYGPGDRVQLGGIQGDVIDIGLLRTTLMECGAWVRGDLYNGRIVRVANSFVFKEPVFNYSADFPFLWDEVVVPIRYGTDHRRAKAIAETVLAEEVGVLADTSLRAWRTLVGKYRLEDAQTTPMVSVTTTDNYVALILRYVVDYRRRRATKDRIVDRILRDFADTDGGVALYGTVVDVTSLPPVEVRVAGR